MNIINPLGQDRSKGVCKPDRTAKVHNKSDKRSSIPEELRAFAHGSFKNALNISIAMYSKVIGILQLNRIRVPEGTSGRKTEIRSQTTLLVVYTK